MFVNVGGGVERKRGIGLCGSTVVICLFEGIIYICQNAAFWISTSYHRLSVHPKSCFDFDASVLSNVEL